MCIYTCTSIWTGYLDAAIYFVSDSLSLGLTDRNTAVLGRQSLQVMEGTANVGHSDPKLSEDRGKFGKDCWVVCYSVFSCHKVCSGRQDMQ